MSGGVPKRISISRTQRNTYCKAGGKDKVQGLVLCSGRRSQRAMCNYVMRRTNPTINRVDIKGGYISRDGGDIIHTFATPGTYIFSIDIVGKDYLGYELEFDTLVVGGGGGGGGANADARSTVGASPIPTAAAAGGGGGGDFIDTSGNKIIIQNGMKYQVIVGGGGAGGTTAPTFGGVSHFGDSGGNSSFYGYPALGGGGGHEGSNGVHPQFGEGGDATGGGGGDHSSLLFRYGGGGGGAGFGQAGTDASFNAAIPDASGGQGGFDPTSGTSSITGTSTTYGGGGGGGVVWFNNTAHTPELGLGGGKGGDGGYYITTPDIADNSFNPVGYSLTGLGSSYYGYSVPGSFGSVADLSLNILGTDYTIADMLWDGSENYFSLCLHSSTLQDNSFNSISFVSNVPGSEVHTYDTNDASFSTVFIYKCWTWTPAQSGFTNDATYWSDASGNNLDIYLDLATGVQSLAPKPGSMGGGGGGATSSDIQNDDGGAALHPARYALRRRIPS